MVEGRKKDQDGTGFRILYQILATMLVIALIPLGGLYYISIYKSRQEWTDNIMRSLKDNTEGLTRSVEDWTAMNFRVLQQNSATPAMLSMDAAQQNPVLLSMTKTFEWVYLAHTILPDGQNVGRSDGQPLLNYGDRVYVQQILAGQAMGQQVLIGKTSKKPALTLSAPIKAAGGKIIGIAAIAMSLEDLSKTVTKTRIGKTGYAILLDENNRLIAHGNGAISSELQDYSKHPTIKQHLTRASDSFVFDEDGKEIVAYSQKTKMGWTLIVQQDYQEAYAAADEARRNTLILLFVTLATVVVIAYLLAQRLSTPIRNLTTIADEISRGNLGAEIKETGRSDEIGALARAIERMGVSLQLAFDRLRKR